MKYFAVTERAWDGGDHDTYKTLKFRTREEAEKVANRETKNHWFKTGPVVEVEDPFFDNADEIVARYEDCDARWG